MNDIYEYKAKKYKHKYLKLKKKYIGGGMMQKILRYTNGFPSKRDKKKITDHKKSASSDQKNLKNKLILLKNSIIKDIQPLYNKNQIISNINFNNIFYKGDKIMTPKYNIDRNDNIHQINNITDNEITFKFNTNNPFNIDIFKIENNCLLPFSSIKNIEKVNTLPQFLNYMKKIFQIIKNNNKPFYPPILIWFYKLFETQLFKNIKTNKTNKHIIPHNQDDTYITEKELYTALGALGDDNKPFITEFKNNFEKCLKKNIVNNHYLMQHIFGYCILVKPYIKNIDYYSLTIVICEIYEHFNEHFEIVEDTSKSEIRLPQLFKNFKEKFNDNSIDENSFFEQLDLIISVIK